MSHPPRRGTAREAAAFEAPHRGPPLGPRLKVAYRRWRERSEEAHGAGERTHALEKVTLVVKAFERPHVLESLLDSIDRFYGRFGPHLCILVGDDSLVPRPPRFPCRNALVWIPLPYDIGVSAGRNALVDRVTTPYLLLLDDDYVFTEATSIETMVSTMEEFPQIDILAGVVVDRGRKPRRICRTTRLVDGVLLRSRVPKAQIGPIRFWDYVPQFFLAKTDAVRRVRWRDAYKIGGEHEAFFLDAQAHGVTVAEHTGVVIHHFQRRTDWYRAKRNRRCRDYEAMFMSDFGIKESVELEGPLPCDEPGA